MGVFQADPFLGNLVTGIVVASIVGTVIFGGIKRIAKVASRLVPTMVVFYLLAAIIILGKNLSEIPTVFKQLRFLL